MSSSTELHGAWPLQNIPDDRLAEFLKLPRHEVHGRREALDRQMRDPAWIAATLEAMPAAVLAVLHLVIDAGGLIAEDALVERAAVRFGTVQSDSRAAAAEAIHRMLAVPLMSRSGERMLAAVQPPAGLIAPWVAGLDLLELPAAGFTASEASALDPRMFVAVCAAARHAEIKLTMAGQIHRGSLKRLARQVGLAEDALAALLTTGLGVGVLQVDGDSVRVDATALEAAAEGRYPHYPPLAALAAELGDAALDGHSAAMALQRSRAPENLGLRRGALGHLPGFAVGTVKGIEAYMRRPPGGAVAGHVTPSFEVFLPPESRLIDVVHVGGCCEWERLDRAFVARITRPSIARAVAAGQTGEQILARLAAASRHPIPQNVEAAIRDWGGMATSATIVTGHVIVVDPSASSRVAPALARFAAREVAPGVFLVDKEERLRDITVALGRAGVQHREAPASGGAPSGSAAGSEAAPAVAAAVAPQAARLRARVSAWRRGEPFEGVRDDFLEKHRAAHPAPPMAEPGRSRPSPLERWVAGLDARARRDLPRLEAIARVVDLIPASELEALLDGCVDIEELIAELARFAVAHPRSSSRRPSPAGTGPRRQRPPTLLWQNEELRERLRRAGQHGEALALDLATGVRYVEISRVMQRGTTWMVLGDDLARADAVALPLDAIRAVAALPDDFDVTSDALEKDLEEDLEAPPVRRPWRPAAGQAAPPGHVLCPCGSGERYRKCCRAVVTA